MLTLATEGRRPRPMVAPLRDRARLGGARARSPASRCCARSTRSRCRSRSRVGVAATLLVRRRAPAERARAASRAGPRPLTGLSAGALVTSTNTSGPPLLLYLLGRGDEPERVRDTLTVCQLGLSVIGAARARRRPAPRARSRAAGSSPCSCRSCCSRTSPGGRCSRASPSSGRYEPVLNATLVVAVVAGLVDRRALSAYRLRRMAQAHGDRLTAVDASFLAQEVENAHMHVGAVLIFEGPPPDYEDFCNQIRSRLHLVPRYRQKLAFPPLETGRPLWVDDPNFNLEYHVRHTALPSPGSEEQLRALAARVHSQRLDRSKPLWETWLVQGLEEQPLRADLQDPPRARRRRRRRRPRDGAVRPRARAAVGAARGRAVGARARAERGRSSPRAGSRASSARRSSSAGKALGAAAHPHAQRSRSRARRSRASARSRGPG